MFDGVGMGMALQPRVASGAGIGPISVAAVQVTATSEALHALWQPDGPQILNEGFAAHPEAAASAPVEIPAGAWHVRALF